MKKKEIIILLLVLVGIFLAIGVAAYFSNNKIEQKEEDKPVIKETEKKESHKVSYDLDKLFECTNEDTTEKCTLENGIVIDYNFDIKNDEKIIVKYKDNKVFSFGYMGYWVDDKDNANLTIKKQDNFIIIMYNNSPMDAGQEFAVVDLEGNIKYISDKGKYELVRIEEKDGTYLLNYEYNKILLSDVYECTIEDQNRIKEEGNIFVKFTEGVKITDKVDTYYTKKVNYQEFCSQN